jgi:NAD-dependent SIR2 family protein deacetylase
VREMSRYANEDILGLHLNNGGVTCEECSTETEWADMTEDEIIVENEEEVVFCDRCKKKL